MAKSVPPEWFTPRPYQEEVFRALQRGIRKFLLIWPRRHGKDLTCNIAAAMAYSLGLVGPGTCMYLFPEKGQGHEAIWQTSPAGRPDKYVDVFPNIVKKYPRESILKFEYPRLPDTWDTPFRRHIESLGIPFSWRDYAGQECSFEIHDARADSVVGAGPQIMICSEFGLPAMAGFYDYAKPIQEENKGLLILNGTVRGKNHMYKLYNQVKDNPEWFVSYIRNGEALKADGTQVMSDADLQRALSEAIDIATARQEYTNDWELPSAGAYYTEPMLRLKDKGQIGIVPFNPSKPVFTGWDLGLSDQTVIWFAQPNDQGGLNLIDYEAGTNASFFYWLEQLRTGIRMQYSYWYHFMPHDVLHVKDSMDATKNPESRYESAYKLGYTNIIPIKSPPGSVNEGISQVSAALNTCFFDRDACEAGLESLRQYRAAETSIVTSSGRKLLAPKPYHDEHSDPADAFRILIVGYNQYVKPLNTKRINVGFSQKYTPTLSKPKTGPRRFTL